MKGSSTRSLGAAVLFLMLSGSAWTLDRNQDPDPCETQALQAYWQALKLCELAEAPNPRLRCHEAARAVYIQTLEQCHRRPR
jgi:hypothetical protein